MPQSIRIETLGDLVAHDYGLNAMCERYRQRRGVRCEGTDPARSALTCNEGDQEWLEVQIAGMRRIIAHQEKLVQKLEDEGQSDLAGVAQEHLRR